MDKNVIIRRYCEACIELAEYNNADQLLHNEKFDPKKTVRMGKKIYSYVKKILFDFLEDFILLLDHDDIRVRKMTAEYLYPLYPSKCLNILKDYEKYLSNDIDKYTLQTKINGLQNKQKFFIDSFKEIYQCDDLDSLNREK